MKSTRIYKYDAEGNFLCEYTSYHAAALAVNRNRSNIRKAVRRKNKSAGFYFSEIYLVKFPIVLRAPRYLFAFKKSDSSAWIKCDSLRQASKETNIPPVVIKWLLDEKNRKTKTVFKDLRGKKDVKNQISFYIEKTIGKPVPVVLHNGKTKKEFKSLKAAALFLKVNSNAVSTALKNKVKLHGWSIKGL